MSEELRKAAEIITKDAAFIRTLPKGMIEQSALDLAEAYLAEHPADDDSEQPITEEWLMSIGFTETGNNSLRIENNGASVELEISRISKGTKWWGPYICDEYCWPNNVGTRGQLRQLLKALGVEGES